MAMNGNEYGQINFKKYNETPDSESPKRCMGAVGDSRTR